MILSLLSLLGGGFMRLLPELVGLWNKKTDNSHELAMMDRQLELQRTKGADDRALVVEQSNAALSLGEQSNDAAAVLAMLDAQKEALHDQMQKTGLPWVDGLNILVRPLTTYYVLFLYGLAKVALFAVAVQQGEGAWTAVLLAYDDEDRAILSGILAFWFVGRIFDKKP